MRRAGSIFMKGAMVLRASQHHKKRIMKNHKLLYWIPVAASLIDVLIEFLIPTNEGVNIRGPHYFGYLMMGVAAIYAVIAVIAHLRIEFGARYRQKVRFYTAAILFAGFIEILTDKLILLPAVYFPSINNILAVAIAERAMLAQCVLYSLRLLLLGILCGGAVGVVTGIMIGWSKRINYWIAPITRFIGPLPTAIWIPISLLIFPNLLSASVFIVALTMWFPTNVQTMSGIQNVKKGYYDVADTMGASTLYQIIHIAIPAAAPQIFVGIFSGVTASFISLMLAELMGSRYGIGWYINWKQQIMAYPNVWSALFLLAMICYLTLQVLFALRRKFLGWQEGIIRW